MKTNEKMKAYPEVTDTLVVEVGEGPDTVQVYRDAAGIYQVVRDGQLRHPNCSAEAAMAALANYLQSALYAWEKCKAQP